MNVIAFTFVPLIAQMNADKIRAAKLTRMITNCE